MALSVYALIGVVLIVLAGSTDARQCGLVHCPLQGYPELTQCCSYSVYNTACCSVGLAGWAVGIIVTTCFLVFGGVILCCLCCACCPVFQYRQQRQTTFITTTGPNYQTVAPVACTATTTKVYA
ncbi:uncharacterized protein LOC135810855 [Sycon ciliatum]|uniref:uncharacterized protein LOC135810855 n=1 Tax=Sycon ciliatum TaxID=27933 RepID=UPI0031F6F18D